MLNFTSTQPNDLTRQSLPFSYMTLGVASRDGAAHSVQVYADIRYADVESSSYVFGGFTSRIFNSAEWVSGDDTLTVTWSTDPTTNGLVTHQVQLQTQETYTEVNDRIQRS